MYNSKKIYYKKGFKYQLDRPVVIQTNVFPVQDIETEFIDLYVNGKLLIKKGYAWDGPSGPTFDTKNFMRGSLVHDALYQLMRMGLLGSDCRKLADKELCRICREDGMSAMRAWWVYNGLRFGGGAAADPKNIKKVYSAP